MLTVMVVDDDPLLCTAMRRKIEMIDRENQLGIQETLIAHSAQEAWGILQEKSVDILISDIRMPYQTGLEPFDLRFSSAQAATEQSRFPRFQARIHSAFQSRNFAELYQLLQKIFCRDFFQEQPFPKEIRRFYVYWESQVQEMASAYPLELEAFPHFSRFASLNEMQEYLQKVLKQMEAAVQTATNKYAHILSIAKQYVQNNYNRDISMDEVAEMVSMSYSYFSRVFKEQLHQSFSEYVLSVRMREAKRLMEEDPAIKIKEVAELVGYESVYTFSRAYKQYYHVSPKQDRDG